MSYGLDSQAELACGCMSMGSICLHLPAKTCTPHPGGFLVEEHRKLHISQRSVRSVTYLTVPVTLTVVPRTDCQRYIHKKIVFQNFSFVQQTNIFSFWK